MHINRQNGKEPNQRKRGRHPDCGKEGENSFNITLYRFMLYLRYQPMFTTLIMSNLFVRG